MILWNAIKTGLGRMFDRGADASHNNQAATTAPQDKKPWFKGVGSRLGILLALFVFIQAYYGLGAMLLSTIDDNTNYRPATTDLPAGGSQAVAMVSALMNREVNVHGWKPSQPWLYASAYMDNMPNYQRGILLTSRAFLLEMKDYVARLRGTGGTDPDLDQAFSDFSYAPDVWFFAARFPFLGASSPHFYRDGISRVRAYNARVASHQAVYEPRVDTLSAVINRLSLSLGDASNDIKLQMASPAGLLDTKADDVFYRTKGQAYAALMLLQAMRQDYDRIIRDRAAANVWAAMSDELKAITNMRPFIVSNGSSDSTLVANHLAIEGVALERARQRMRELLNILQQ